MRPLPLAERLVEVIADRGEECVPRYRSGSGCRVNGRTVLTAAHVIAGAVSVMVRGPDKIEHRAALDPAFIGDIDGPAPDLALIEVAEDDVAVTPMPLAAVDRDSPAGIPVERCQAIGYPEFMEQVAADGGRFREIVDAVGYVPVLSRLARGLLSVEVSNSPASLPAGQEPLEGSPWSGMSGAPVVADGYLLAVVTEHAKREGSSSITATPLTALESDPRYPLWGRGVLNPGEWWERLGVPGSNALKRLPAPTGGPPAAADYRRYYGARLTTGVEQFVDRNQKRAQLRKLLFGKCRIISITGHRGIGKSALVARVLAEYETSNSNRKPASDIDAVVYLSTRDETAGITRDRIYLSIAELAADSERENLEQLWNNHDRVNSWPELFRAFSSRKSVVVLDNLDEIQDAAGSLREPDIAEFLNEVCRTPSRFHVVTTSQRPLLLPRQFEVTTYVMPIDDGLDPPNAVKLLRVLDADGRAGLRDADENDLRSAAQRLYGTPRGLQLLAGSLKRRPTLRVQDALAGGPTLDEILAELISTEYGRLNEVESGIVRMVVVAGVPLPGTALAPLLPEWSPASLAEALDDLVEEHVLSFDRSTGQVSMHPLDADYVLNIALGPRSNLVQELHRRLAEWYVTQRNPAASRQTLADINAERREIAHRVAIGDHLGALSTLADIAEFMARHGGIEELRANAVANDDDPIRMRIDAGWCKGFADFFGGSLHKALAAFNSARQLITDPGMDPRGPTLDYWLGATFRHMGRASAAVEVLNRAVGTTPDPAPRVRALFELGLTYCYLKDQSSAGAVVIELEKLVGPDSPAIMRGQLHNMRALVKLVTPDYEGCIEEVDKGLNFYRATQQQDNEGFLWNLRGLAQLGADNEDGAITDLTRGRDCADKYGVVRLQGICWTNLAWAFLRKGKLQEATDAAAGGEDRLRLQGTTEVSGAELLRRALTSRPPSIEACRDQLAEAVAGSLGNPDFYQPSEQLLASIASRIANNRENYRS